MKTLLISAVMLASTLPFLASADTTDVVKVDRSNGPAYFGQRVEWKDAPVVHSSIWGDVQDISGTQWYKDHMRSLAQQLKAKGLLSLFPSLQAWAN
jgi:hypothetical protein